jgi:uncharacterized FlaG/YvyC family protein
MAIAGIQQAAINPLGANKDQVGIAPRASQNLAAVKPIESAARGEGKKVSVKSHAGELDLANTRFEFSIHEGTKEVMVKVIDEISNETIREIPPEEVLDMIAKMWEIAGIMVDQRA